MDAPDIRAPRIVALALVVGIFFTAQTIFMALSAGRTLNFEWDVLQELLYWLVWALLAPAIVAGVRRWPLDARPARRSIAAHVIMSLVVAPLQTLVAFGLHLAALVLTGAVAPDGVFAWMARQRPALVWGVFMGVAFYWAVAGVYTAIRLRQLYVAEQLSAAELAGQSAGLQAELARAQLDALRSQLRPHFLFNTLNAISVLTVEDPGKARQMLLRLGSLLRRSLDEEEHEVPLHQELAFLNEYLDIQRVRFGERLAVELAIDPSAVNARVPVFLLQPLVENAIEHGAAQQDCATTISLSAARIDDTLRMTVRDNGPGPGDGRAVREGIGLSNTRERLRQLYADRAVLDFRAVRDAPGACVDITIPLVRGDGVKVLVVDDEPLARRGLRRELQRIAGMTCVGECAGVAEAVAAIVEHRPDVVLLDVQLGRATAFEVIEQIGVDAMPLVVFVTAYDRHALRAFEVNAVDYVLKPVDPERLREALDRAAHLRSLEQGASLADRLERLLAAQASTDPGPPRARETDRIVVRDGGRLAFVDVSAIDWIEADGNYVRVHIGAKMHSLRTTMARMERRVGGVAGPDVAGARFVRIRRSALINISAIVTLEPYGKGMYLLQLRNGARLISSRYHQTGLRRVLGKGPRQKA